MDKFLLLWGLLLVMEAFQSTQEAVHDGSRVQEIRRRGEPMGGRLSGWFRSFGRRFTPVIQVCPARRDQRFRSVGQDEGELKNSASVGVAPERQRLTFERVLGAEDSDL